MFNGLIDPCMFSVVHCKVIQFFSTAYEDAE
jgi:hypothetical protein